MRELLLILVFTAISQLPWSAQSQEINPGTNLSATDALGRKLPSYRESGASKPGKYAALFYWTWHTDNHASFSPVLNITRILNQYPEAALDANHPAWRGITGGVFWWDEPLFGYYRTTDDWVLRKHAEMLADAGIDVVFFDCTNGNMTWKTSYTKLMECWEKARTEGVHTPQVAFLLPFSPTEGSMEALVELYDELYQPGKHANLWFKWQGKPLIMAYPESVKAQRNSAGLKFTATSPFYAINATCPSWGNNLGSLTFRLYKWNNSYAESVEGSVLAEKTIENFPDNGKLPLTFSKQEAGTYLWELSHGTEMVGVWKYDQKNETAVSYFNGKEVSGNYESEISYTTNLQFTKLTTGTAHSPVRIIQPVDQQKVDAIKSFFTFRPGQPDYKNGPSRNDQWGWLEVFPQHGYGPKGNGKYEQTTVGVAQNASDASGGHASGFNSPLTYGRSFTRAAGQDSRPDACFYGLNFDEQWERAHQIDPDLVFITGWNEWIAGRWFDWDVKPFAFVDEYSAEKSRDIEPVKSWGNKGDLYYLQMISHIRKFKGMPEEEPASPPTSIRLEEMHSWDNVGPVYRSHKGNTLHRNHPGQGNELTYVNTSGRNDITGCKVARDSAHLWFWVETAAPLTSPAGKNWMWLFIDTDRNKQTGWEGYDFLINREKSGDSVSVEKNGSGWNWTPIGKGAFHVEGNQLAVQFKRSLLKLDASHSIDLEFKWSDHMQEEGNIMDFYVNGDAAPGGRFNFHYFTSTETYGKLTSEPDFLVYPNPAVELIHISFPRGTPKNSHLTLYDLSGRTVWRKYYPHPVHSEEIGTSDLRCKGFCIVELKTDRGVKRAKILIQ